MVMGMGGRAELYSCILFDIVLEYFCHIIIEHIRIGTRVHTNDRFFKLIPPVRYLIFHKGKVRYRFGVIILQSVGIQADKLHISCDEREVCGAEYSLVGFRSRSQTVMISDQSHIRHMKSVHDIPLPKKFLSQSEVTHIPSVDNEVNIISLIDCFYKIFRFVIPSL